MNHCKAHLLKAVLAALLAVLLLAACSPKPLEEKDLVSKLRRSDAFLPGKPKIESYEVLDRSTDKKEGADTLTVTVRTEKPVETELTYDLTFALKDDDWRLTSVERAEDGPWTLEGPSRRELQSAAQERDDFLKENEITDVTVETVSEDDDFDPEDGTYTKELTLSLTAPYGDTSYRATVKAAYTLTEDGWEPDRWKTTDTGFAAGEAPDDIIFTSAVRGYCNQNGISYDSVTVTDRGADLEAGTAWAEVTAAASGKYLSAANSYRVDAVYLADAVMGRPSWTVPEDGVKELGSAFEWADDIFPVSYKESLLDPISGSLILESPSGNGVNVSADLTLYTYGSDVYRAKTSGTVNNVPLKPASDGGWLFSLEGAPGDFFLDPYDMSLYWYYMGYDMGWQYCAHLDPTFNASGSSASNLDYAAGTSLRMAVGYGGAKTGISFDWETAGGGIALANGVAYYAGDLKPAWQELEKRLSLDFIDIYRAGNSPSGEYGYWAQCLDEVDVLVGSASDFNKAGPEGDFVDLSDYLDEMPNLKAFMAADPVSYASLLSPVDGGLYYLPYADGLDDVTRVPLMRTDWVEKLLNGSGKFTAGSSNRTLTPVYQPYMPTAGEVTVIVVRPNGAGVETVTKDYDAAGGNIVALMNARGAMSGVDAVNMLRDYIDKAYGGYYGTRRADLFIGQNAAWDADELVALLRCVVANPQTLNGTDTVQGLTVRDTSTNQRQVDLFRLAGQLFGVRGLDSNFNYSYVGADGALHDARMEPEAYKAMERMNAMAREGLIAQQILDGNTTVKTVDFLSDDSAFMEFDYSQNQTAYNETVLQPGETFRAVLTPVARWNDGSGEAFFRFAENWRDVKIQGIGISRLGINGDQNKLNAALTLFDYLFTKEGRILMSYGPDEFIKMNANGDFATFDFNGEEWPQISDAAYREMWDLCGGNYTTYCHQYLGTFIVGPKAQAMEFQYTCPAGQEGMRIFSNAIALDVLRHPERTFTDDPWYTSVPIVLPLSQTPQQTVDAYPDFNNQFSQNMKGFNAFVDIIINGYAGRAGFRDANDAAQTVSSAYGGSIVLTLYNEALRSLRSAYAN